MKNSNPSLTPFVMIFALIILFTIIVSNIRNPEESGQPEKKRSSTQGLIFNPRLSTGLEPDADKSSVSDLPDTQMLAASALTDWHSGNFREAEDKFRTILVFSPNNPVALSHLGALLHHRGDYENAELMFRRQTLYFPGDPGAYQNLGAILAKQNKFKEAIQVSKRGLDLAPSSPSSVLILAKVYSLAGSSKLALEYFRRAASMMGRGIVKASWDPAFDNIRKTEEFSEILREASKGDMK